MLILSSVPVDLIRMQCPDPCSGITSSALRVTASQKLVSGGAGQNCQTWFSVALAVLGLQLDSMILKVFPNVNDSVIPDLTTTGGQSKTCSVKEYCKI